MANKEIEQLVRQLRRQDFDVLHTKSGHYKIKKDGRVVGTLPCTPGGGGGPLKWILRREIPKFEAAGFRRERV